MAFNFNWSPLAADENFYTRARELLTNALNRGGPRPAIIVDDILVTELNLGDVPPSLEIVEIGDLAEDRFRGTFKMSYNGNAYLALKTRVQANPLNTYLNTRPSFASPQPLAAATGLTIPLQITLSDIRLSGFIILVFSRQKGLTIVFKDDPLQSLKVSSTFDSIPFVANFLQKEIDGQLRVLLMDELPAIIHRLSLRLWVPEHNAQEERRMSVAETYQDEVAVDPLASPPQDPVDSSGNVLSPAEVASMSLDSSVETQSLFSQKNLIRLATLTDSHRTLSLFTPSIRDAVFRAWTGPLERGEMAGPRTRSGTPAISRTQSYTGSLSTAQTFDSSTTRPTLYSFHSSPHGIGFAGARHGKTHGGRKRKKRVVNLRKQPETGEPEVVIEDGSTVTDTASVTESTSTDASVFSAPAPTSSSGAYRDVEVMTPPSSPIAARNTNPDSVEATPKRTLERRSLGHSSNLVRRSTAGGAMPEDQQSHEFSRQDRDATIRPRRHRVVDLSTHEDITPRASMYLAEKRASSDMHGLGVSLHQDEKASMSMGGGSSKSPLPNLLHFVTDPANGGSLAERAWMSKIASEVQRRYEEEREKGNFGSSSRSDEERPPPPAYAM